MVDSQAAYERFSDACRMFAKSLIKVLIPWLSRDTSGS